MKCSGAGHLAVTNMVSCSIDRPVTDIYVANASVLEKNHKICSAQLDSNMT